jgi:sulfur relay (sulfurtransferase) complex TusBCD TusD component (DsrE family)
MFKVQVMKKSFAIGVLALASVVSVQAQELFVNIHSGNAMAQGAGLVLAGQAMEQKASVRILLCDAAGDIAVNGQSGPALKPRNVTTQQMLQGLIKGGAKVEVCALYLPNTGRQASDLIEGVSPAKPADVAAHLLKPTVKTLAF